MVEFGHRHAVVGIWTRHGTLFEMGAVGACPSGGSLPLGHPAFHECCFLKRASAAGFCQLGCAYSLVQIPCASSAIARTKKRTPRGLLTLSSCGETAIPRPP